MLTRLITFAILLIIGGAVAADYNATADALKPAVAATPSAAADDDAPSVAKVCGFAPCGMPLDCD